MKALLVLVGCLVLSAVALGQDIDLTGYTLTFSDEFEIESVSPNGATTKAGYTWYHLPPYGPAGNYSASKWTHCSGVNAGSLTISAAYHAPDWYSGQISSMDPTKAGFSQKYGYFSARIKMPESGQGAWPSFWMQTVNTIPDNKAKHLEIDVVEWYGNNPTRAQQVTHNWNADGSQQFYYLINPVIPGGNASTQYHIYGVKVDPANITFFIDGIQTGQTPTPADYIGPMYLMLAYALGGGWPITGEPFASKGKSVLWIDWVRVYALPPEAPAPTPTPGYIEGYFEGTIKGIFIPTP